MLLPSAGLPLGFAGQNGTETLLAAAPVSSITGVTPCPVGWYCPGGDPMTDGVPQPCPTGLTTSGTGAASSARCNGTCHTNGANGRPNLDAAGCLSLQVCLDACKCILSLRHGSILHGRMLAASTSARSLSWRLSSPPASCFGQEWRSEWLCRCLFSFLPCVHAVLLPGFAPVAPDGSIVYANAGSTPFIVTNTTDSPVGYFCSGGQIPAAGYPVPCSNGLTSLAHANSSDVCNSKCTSISICVYSMQRD